MKDDCRLTGKAALGRSIELHQAVLRYAELGVFSLADFMSLAAAISTFQDQCQVLPGRSPRKQAAIPFPGLTPVTADTFRFSTPFNFSPEQAAASFRTSGTTTPHPGQHLLRSTATYCELALNFARRSLTLGPGETRQRYRVLALMPPLPETCRSSLAFMSAQFMSSFDGHGLRRREKESFSVREPGRWLLSENGVQVQELQIQVAQASTENEPILLLTTSFALVMLLDQLGSETLPLPAGSVLMTTGGFKGRSRELEASQLYRQAFERLGPERVVGEYGMTELSSQLYERPSYVNSESTAQGLYFEPSWLRVYPLDPVTHQPVPDGEVGLACFVDLGNVDSAVCVLTQDLVRREEGGVRLLGRATRAVVRGCSLAVEELWKPLPGADPSASVVKSRPAANPPTPALAAPPVSDEAAERVRRLLQAGALIKDGATSWGLRAREAWVQRCGMSSEGVELGIQHSLESEVGPEQLLAFCASVRPAHRVWVNLSANMPVAPLRAIALALAASPRVFVRASRRDPVLATLLQQATSASGDELFELVDELRPQSGDHVFAYGSDETLSAIRDGLPTGVTFDAHGSGFGAVVLFPEDDLQLAAERVALDVVLFDQQGCLSPRLALLRQDVDHERFVGALSDSLAAWQERVPLGQIISSLAAEQAWARATFERMAEVVPAGPGFVATQQAPALCVLAPAARNLVVYRCSEPHEVIRSLASRLTTVAYARPAAGDALSRAAPLARFCEIGEMQRPGFDGPVDRRGR